MVCRHTCNSCVTVAHACMCTHTYAFPQRELICSVQKRTIFPGKPGSFQGSSNLCWPVRRKHSTPFSNETNLWRMSSASGIELGTFCIHIMYSLLTYSSCWLNLCRMNVMSLQCDGSIYKAKQNVQIPEQEIKWLYGLQKIISGCKMTPRIVNCMTVCQNRCFGIELWTSMSFHNHKRMLPHNDICKDLFSPPSPDANLGMWISP